MTTEKTENEWQMQGVQRFVHVMTTPGAIALLSQDSDHEWTVYIIADKRIEFCQSTTDFAAANEIYERERARLLARDAMGI